MLLTCILASHPAAIVSGLKVCASGVWVPGWLALGSPKCLGRGGIDEGRLFGKWEVLSGRLRAWTSLVPAVRLSGAEGGELAGCIGDMRRFVEQIFFGRICSDRIRDDGELGSRPLHARRSVWLG